MDFFKRKVSIFSDIPKNAKKISRKLKVKKNSAKSIEIINANPENYFWINNGNVLKNLHDFQDALVVMTEEQYDFHTKRDGNDFAKWVEEIFGEKELAKKIAKAKSKKGTMVVLAQYVG
jgi:hypothetical protein